MMGCEILPSARTASGFPCLTSTTRNIIARIRPLIATPWVQRTARPRLWIFVALCLTVATSTAPAAQTLRIGLQKTGTFAWQLDVVRRHGLADTAGLDLAITEFASPDAGKLALNSGAVDLVVSDWLRVARERALGAKLLFYPYSSSAGAVMVRADSPMRGVSDLKGSVLAVAGGPLDKSWLIVRAAALRRGVDLKRETTLQYGAPPLIFQTSQRSDVEASLNFWNFCARLEALGYRRLFDVQSAEIELGLKQSVALIGFVFSEPFAATHHDLIDSFIAVTQQANDIMLKSDKEWAALRPLMQVEDDATFESYRSHTREGMPHRSLAEEAADARLLFKTLADTGGQQLVGPASELDPDLYYHPSAHGE